MIRLRAVRLPTDPLTTALHDLTVEAGRIVAVQPAGRAGQDGRPTIDGGGRLAMPGFLDAHAHVEGALFTDEVQHALLRQGVTSVVVGNDGVSFAPAPGPTGQWASDYFAAINGSHPAGPQTEVADLLAGYQGAVRVNVAMLVPHGNLRHAVVGGADRPAAPAELDQMRQLLRAGLDQGACGMSTGLEYQPGGFADLDELTALTGELAARGLPHVSHMRGYELDAVPALAELAEIARGSRVATHVSHLHGPATPILAALAATRAEGLDITFDSYPYLRGASILSMIAMPDWIPLAEPAVALTQLRREEVQQRLLREHLPGLADVWPRVTMAYVPGEHAWAEGHSLLQVAERLGVPPARAVLDLLVSTDLRAGCTFAQPPSNSEAAVRALLRDTRHLAASDAIYAGSRPHPRGWGTFARFLAEHVRRHGDWTWAQAAWHLSGAAAQRFRLADRGSLRVGSAADIVLVDPDTVQDNATYADPRRLASGIDDVLVNGRLVLAGGELTDERAGAPVRPQQGRAQVPPEHRSLLPAGSPGRHREAQIGGHDHG